MNPFKQFSFIQAGGVSPQTFNAVSLFQLKFELSLQLIGNATSVNQKEADIFVRQLLFEEFCISRDQTVPNFAGPQFTPHRICCPLNQVQVAGGTVQIRCSATIQDLL